MGTFTVKEFNQLCAEFLGYKNEERVVNTSLYEDNRPTRQLVFEKGIKFYTIDKLKFDSDWNWIMIVVEKIEKTYDDFHGYFSVQMVGNTCSIVGTKLRTGKENYHPAYYHSLTMDTKLESTVHVIYEFLLWKKMNYDNKTD